MGPTTHVCHVIEQPGADAVRRARTTALMRSMFSVPTLTVLLLMACVAVVALDPPSPRILLQGLLWTPLIAATQLTRITATPQMRVDRSLASIVVVAAALLLPVGAVVAFTFIGLLSPQELNRQASLVMALFNRAQFALSGAAAAAAAALIGVDSVWRLALAGIVASVAFAVVNNLFLASVMVIRRARTWRPALIDASNPFPRFVQNAAVSTTLSVLLAVLVRDVGWWSVGLLAAPLWLSHSAQGSARRAQDRAEQLADRVRELETLNNLSGELLSVHAVADVPGIVSAALERALGTDVTVDLTGARDASAVPSVPVAGSEPAAILVPDGMDDDARTVVEASAALLGLTLTRLAVEDELAETERARTALTARILEEATHERSRIAVGIHDNVLPQFAAAAMRIDILEVTLQRDPSGAGDLIDSAMEAVNTGIAELRDTLEALSGSTLVPGGLRDGVGKLLAELQSRTGVRARLDAPDPMPAVPFAVELLAFETVRGTLANVERHAAATSFRVELNTDDGRLVALMHDDGRGFDPETVGRRSHGLALMRQRAELARGRLDVSSASGVGTTVRLEVPTW
jgi:signal transduction histidine kinase